ncbi:MAG TPA: hypothetical protein VN750_04695 [Steroidobacteraceae bacterium]|nr:hypothetical protein [Steroidobacteraceae bacterium]
MNAERRSYVLNLPEWELPRLDDLEFALVEELAARARAKRINSESLEDVFSELLHNRLLTLVESAVNETIEYWLKGLGDGNDGHWPELRVELPYLEHREITEPLTLTYCVDNGDDTRTELNRTHLGAVMARFLEDADPPARLRGRARVVADELRQLAQKLEELSSRGS